MKLRKIRRDIDGEELWNMTHKYVRSLKYAKIEEFLPHYILSAVGHVANMHNMGALPHSPKKPFYVGGGMVKNLKLNMMMVAPAGFTKTTILNIFTDSDVGILFGAIPVKEVGTISSAGLVGSMMNEKVEKGLASNYKYHIISAEEWTGISTMMEQKHSQVMQSELLKVLDSGKIQKNIKGMDFTDRTYMTLWAGVQNALFDVKSGFNRRFIFIDASPSMKDIRDYRRARRETMGIGPDLDRITELRDMYARMYYGLHVDGEVKISQAWKDYVDGFDILHSEDDIMDKIGIVYTMLLNYDDGDLIVTPEPKLKEIVNTVIKWRERLSMSQTNATILSLVKGSDGWKKTDLEKVAMKLGMSREEFRSALSEYIVEGELVMRKEKRDGKGRPVYYVYDSEAIE